MKAEYVNHMGDDLMVVNTARVSFANESWFINEEYLPPKGSKHFQAWFDYASRQVNDKSPIISVADFGLIHFLATHGHWTPFAHPQISLRMAAPVPIRTQCFKHKQGFVENEESRRYISCRPEIYIPDYRMKPENAKQGSAGPHPRNEMWRDIYDVHTQEAVNLYEEQIEDGIAPEQARFILPQGAIVQWIWTGSLAAFARFYKQRTDSHAQGEVQGLARNVGSLVEPLFPVSWRALT